MREVTKDQAIMALRALGLRPGDGLLVHSAIQFLGRPVGGVGMYLEALCSILEVRDSRVENGESRVENGQFLLSNLGSRLSSGTIAVPTFNFAFAG